MIITLKKDAKQEETEKLLRSLENKGLSVNMIQGDTFNVFGLVGDTSKLDERLIKAHPFVENVQRIAAPYKLANRMFHPQDTIVDVNGIHIGGKEPIVVIGGPCSVESEEMIERIAYKAVSYTHLDVYKRQVMLLCHPNQIMLPYSLFFH